MPNQSSSKEVFFILRIKKSVSKIFQCFFTKFRLLQDFFLYVPFPRDYSLYCKKKSDKRLFQKNILHLKDMKIATGHHEAS